MGFYCDTNIQIGGGRLWSLAGILTEHSLKYLRCTAEYWQCRARTLLSIAGTLAV